ncbi:type I restriction enzyme endonuclease domain-containing protein [Bradyrhizobium sp. LMG 9283]|uniref:type I restriction enzyme endonuclease domain-containing protein n=1 Tax=Bradyrhizobium sp. LMG 9283 TaxID=592064 RepID=UPI00388E4B85
MLNWALKRRCADAQNEVADFKKWDFDIIPHRERIRKGFEVVEQKLAEMLTRNSMRMDYQLKYEAIVAAYNNEKDRATIEETFRRLVELVNSLDEEQARAAREGLSDDELAMFDLLKRDDLNKASRERVKQASRELLSSIKTRLAELDRFWERSRRRVKSRRSFWTRFLSSCRRRPSRPKKRSWSRIASMRISDGKP